MMAAGGLSGTTAKGPSLEKQLGLWDVYALATGATLSSASFFFPDLLPPAPGQPCRFPIYSPP
jgi:hypothetical protein